MLSPLSHHQHQTENGVHQVNFAFQGGNSVPVETRWGGITHMKWKGCCTLQIRNLFCSRCTSCWMGFTLRGSASTCLIHSEKRKHFHHFTYCSCEGGRESFSSANVSVSSWAPRVSPFGYFHLSRCTGAAPFTVVKNLRSNEKKRWMSGRVWFA